MDIEAAYLAFLTALDALPNCIVIGPSCFSTMQNWPLPPNGAALTVDLDQIAIGTDNESAESILATGLTLPICIHVPIDTTNFRGLLSQCLTILNLMIPVIVSSFPNYATVINDMYTAVVAFGRGEAFGCGFTLTISQI
ncbi:MAG TPA: hypothetical protein VGM92_04030 [Candidatus Kapabacteria bacterium]|jgi:hypothetical protein